MSAPICSGNIEASKERAWLSPAGKVFEMFKAAKGAVPLGRSDEPSGRDAGGAPLVRAQALVEKGSDDLLVYVVNKSSVLEHLTLGGLIPSGTGSASFRRISAASPIARVEELREESGDFDPWSVIDVPPYSLTLLRVPSGS